MNYDVHKHSFLLFFFTYDANEVSVEFKYSLAGSRWTQVWHQIFYTYVESTDTQKNRKKKKKSSVISMIHFVLAESRSIRYSYPLTIPRVVKLVLHAVDSDCIHIHMYSILYVHKWTYMNKGKEEERLRIRKKRILIGTFSFFMILIIIPIYHSFIRCD